MRFVTASYHQETLVGVMDPEGKTVLFLKKAQKLKGDQESMPASLVECMELGEGFVNKVKDLVDWVHTSGKAEELYIPLEKVALLAPIPRPRKNIFCVGKNYAEHAIEMGSADDIPKHVIVFSKAPTTVIGSHEQVLNHQTVTNQLDYEGELAVVIGKKGRGIQREEALDYVFGYTIINDISARDLQRRHQQYFMGKNLDTTCPMGPWIVEKGEIPNPNHLNIETKVNGETRQSSNTKNFIFPIEEIIAVLSAGMTLEPGDIIATGTPAGVGNGFKPPKFLHPGDKIEITIEKIGTLVNVIQSNEEI